MRRILIIISMLLWSWVNSFAGIGIGLKGSNSIWGGPTIINGNTIINGYLGIGITPTNELHVYTPTVGGTCIALISGDKSSVQLKSNQVGGQTWQLDSGLGSAGLFSITQQGVSRFFTILPTTGYTGINTSAPDVQLEVNSSTGNCLRLTSNDTDGSASNKVGFNVFSDGGLNIISSKNYGKFGGMTITKAIVHYKQPLVYNAGYYRFNGSTSQIDIPDNDNLDLIRITIVVSFRTSSISDCQELINKSSGASETSAPYRLYLTNTGYLAASVSNGSSQVVATGTVAVSPHRWITGTMVADGDSLVVYADGVKIASAAETYHATANAAILTIGRWGATGGNYYPFFGDIKSVLIFNKALTATELQDILNGSIPPKYEYGSSTEYTSGTLVKGVQYYIKTFVAGDDFTNVGASSNATGISFLSTGTTPTTWTHSSVLIREGCVARYDNSCMGTTQWVDANNGLVGTLSNATLTGSAKCVKVDSTLTLGTFKFVVVSDTLCTITGTDTLRIHPPSP